MLLREVGRGTWAGAKRAQGDCAARAEGRSHSFEEAGRGGGGADEFDFGYSFGCGFGLGAGLWMVVVRCRSGGVFGSRGAGERRRMRFAGARWIQGREGARHLDLTVEGVRGEAFGSCSGCVLRNGWSGSGLIRSLSLSSAQPGELLVREGCWCGAG